MIDVLDFVLLFFYVVVEWGPVVCGSQEGAVCVYFIQLHFSRLPRLCFYGPRTPSGAFCQFPVGGTGVFVLFKFPTLIFCFGGVILATVLADRCFIVFLSVLLTFFLLLFI